MGKQETKVRMHLAVLYTWEGGVAMEQIRMIGTNEPAYIKKKPTKKGGDYTAGKPVAKQKK